MKNLNAANILSLPRIPGKIKQKPSIIAANINKSGKNIGSNMTGVRLSAKKNGNSALCSIFVSVKMYFFLSKIVFFEFLGRFLCNPQNETRRFFSKN